MIAQERNSHHERKKRQKNNRDKRKPAFFLAFFLRFGPSEEQAAKLCLREALCAWIHYFNALGIFLLGAQREQCLRFFCETHQHLF